MPRVSFESILLQHPTLPLPSPRLLDTLELVEAFSSAEDTAIDLNIVKVVAQVAEVRPHDGKLPRSLAPTTSWLLRVVLT